MANEWTQAEDDLLREYYKKRTAKQIGEILCRSYAAVRRRCCDLGLTTPVVNTADFHDEIVELLNRNLTYAQIANRLGLPRSTVGNYIYRHQLKRGVSNLMKDFLYGRLKKAT